MYVLVCRESGLDCDFVIKGETKEECIKNVADHAIQKHGVHADEIYLNDLPVNLCVIPFNECEDIMQLLLHIGISRIAWIVK